MGGGLRGLRRRGEAGLAGRAGRAVLPAGAVGRAGWLPGHRARQLRAAVPHHLGHRPRSARTVHPPGAGGRRARPGVVALQAPRQRADHQRRRGGRRARRGARAEPGGTRTTEFPRGSRGFRAARAIRGRRIRWHRRQFRPGAAELAGALRHAAEGDDRRGTRLCGRTAARRGGPQRRAPHQPGPDVALHRGSPQLRADLE